MRIILPKLMLKVERWKWNKEFRIYVSNMGNFKDEYKKNIPFMTTQTGYLAIKTPYGIKLAHRLVMITWKPIPNAEDLTIDHLNHNKRENTIYNLEWITKEENMERAARDFTPEFSPKKGTPQPNNIPSGTIIAGKKTRFKSFEEAANWVLTQNGDIGTGHIDRVINKIKKAIETKEKYCDRNWSIVK